MVNVEYFAEGPRFEAESVGHQLALEIAHTRLSLCDAPMQSLQSLGGEAVDATRDVTAMERRLVVEAGDAEGVVST